MKKVLITLTLLVANMAHADIAGLRISGGVFDYEVSGTLRDSANAADTVDLKSNLNIADDSDSMAYVYIEHPVPVLPNVRLGSTTVKLAGSGTVGSIDFGGATISGNVTSDIDLSHTEIGLYYEIVDIGIDLDIGLNFKVFDGRATLTGGGNTGTAEIDGVIPMLYAAVNIPLPGGFSLAGDISTLSVDDSSITDYLIRLRYETDFMLGIEAGLRSFSLDYEDTGAQTYSDIEISGPYLAVHLAF